MVYLRLKSMDGKVESESSQGVYRDELAIYNKMSVSSRTIISFFKKLAALSFSHCARSTSPDVECLTVPLRLPTF